MITENEEVIEDEQNISSVAPVDKDKDIEKFLTSLPVNEELERPTVPINSSSQINEQQANSYVSHLHHEVNNLPVPSASPIVSIPIDVNNVLIVTTPNILEKCMDKLVETSSKLVAATIEQAQVNRQLAISGQCQNYLSQYSMGTLFNITCGTALLPPS